MFKLIDDLLRSPPKRREKLLMRTHENNVAFFSKVNPELAEFIKVRGTGPFGIRITDDSLEVFERATGQTLHPPGQLFPYMSDLGQLHHTAWVDKLIMQHVLRGDFEHGKRLLAFIARMYEEFPEELMQRMGTGVVRLPPMQSGQHFSAPVVFLGVQTGLHIMYYLNRTAVRDVFLIEPDVDRFALSCFFLDYQLIEKRFGSLLLHVGPNAPQDPIDQLISRSSVTAASWVRLLPAYPSGEFDDILNRVSLGFRALTEIYVPFDREQNNLVNGLKNIRAGFPLLYQAPELSSSSTVAVVASGPSLNANMEWLKANRDRMIVLASISCVRVLRENGITPDYQCTLDTEIDEPLLEQLRLDFEVPLIAYYKASHDLIKKFKKVLLLHEDHKANCVRFHHSVTHTHPTTGNLMTAVAAWSKPSRLIFLGLDLGFRDPKLSHVRGGWHDENEGIGHDEETGNREHIPVPANFPESEGQILTMAYYNNARVVVEGSILPLAGHTQILNLADGARIKGAEPMHGSELELPEYAHKGEDLERFERGFTKPVGEVFEVYDTTGKELLEEMADTIIKSVELDGEFDWLGFTRALDGAWTKALTQSVQTHRELRIEIFARFVHDILAEWYRIMVLGETVDNVKRLYQRGLEEVKKELSTLPWPEELDALLQKTC